MISVARKMAAKTGMVIALPANCPSSEVRRRSSLMQWGFKAWSFIMSNADNRWAMLTK
jgi:hypothetical protein